MNSDRKSKELLAISAEQPHQNEAASPATRLLEKRRMMYEN